MMLRLYLLLTEYLIILDFLIFQLLCSILFSIKKQKSTHFPDFPISSTLSCILIMLPEDPKAQHNHSQSFGHHRTEQPNRQKKIHASFNDTKKRSRNRPHSSHDDASSSHGVEYVRTAITPSFPPLYHHGAVQISYSPHSPLSLLFCWHAQTQTPAARREEPRSSGTLKPPRYVVGALCVGFLRVFVFTSSHC